MSEHEDKTSVASQIELQLSAFTDGELTAAEAEFLSRRISVEPELRKRLCQYYLIGSVARGEQPVPATFASGLSGRLGEDNGVAAPLPQKTRFERSEWQRIVGGGAIAAGVAMLALFGLNQSVEQANAPQVVESGSGYTVPALNTDAAQPQISLSEPQLVNYMLQHGQLATPLIVETEATALPQDDASATETTCDTGATAPDADCEPAAP